MAIASGRPPPKPLIRRHLARWTPGPAVRRAAVGEECGILRCERLHPSSARAHRARAKMTNAGHHVAHGIRRVLFVHRGGGTRTHDLLLPKQARYQLRHTPHLPNSLTCAREDSNL